MLALLSASLLLTAIIVRSTYTPAVNLTQTAKMLESGLHQKEEYINNAIGTRAGLNRFKTIANNYDDGLKCIREFTNDRSIYVVTYKKNQVQYWSDITVIPPNPQYIKDGYSFKKEANGYYESIKKSDGDFSVIFLIPVKTNYTVQNQYLQNTFSKDLLKDNNIDIADFTDKDALAVRSVSKTSLFWVKVKSNEINYRFFYFELVLWLLTLLVVCVLVQNICSYLVNKDHLFLSFIFLAAFIIGIRYLNLEFNWPNFTHRLEIFNPHLYSAGKLCPSLGDLGINILLASWLVAYIYRQRFKLIKYTPGKTGGYVLILFCIGALMIVSTLLLHVFYGLVVHSNINFDVNNVLGLSGYSLCGILLLCFSFFIFYLLNEVCQTVCCRLPIPAKQQLIIFLIAIVAATCYYSISRNEFIGFYLLWSLIVIIRGYGYHTRNTRTTTFTFAGILLICSIISSINLNRFEDKKEKQNRKALILKLENPTDSTADRLFKKIERQIVTDPFIISYFRDTVHNNDYLQNRLQKRYFDGYLSKYDFKVHAYNAKEQPISADQNYPLSVYKDMVLYSSLKVSNYFYRENESFGFQNYFGILPVTQTAKNLGSIIVELKSKALQTSNYFPELLADGHLDDKGDFKNYSYAFYSDNKLLSQNGNFVYKLVRTNYQYPVKTFNYRTSEQKSGVWYRPKVVYSHLIYKPTERNLIVVSKQELSFFYSITSVTFFFVILLLFSVIVFVASWAWLRIKILTITNNKIKWGLRITLDKILYKTRIQFSMVFAVVITLILVGIVTYISISSQYQNQQDKMIRDRIIKITDAFENGLFDKYITHLNEQSQLSFDALAASYSSDLVLFDKRGALLITTQPRIYEYGLISRRMNARAYITLLNEKRSDVENDEWIGSLNYKTVYAPIRNTKGETIAYLQLPYFSNQADYRERIGSLLNIMIQIYAIIFIAIGLFAVIIARQITNPLNFIQQSLSKTIYGKKNEPIKWDRDDEIGALVKEYNKMIAALEASAARLAQSERESAWREMAKQVAHEIKNPLTPLKLGLQLLEKSWREKDAKFDQKFERFSKSFVEQIESLSQIASEFSAFAKMPDTRMERFDVFEVINQAVTIFKQTDNFTINYQIPEAPFFVVADKDQLLRCFNNLLKNAIEATPPDRPGTLEITYQTDNRQIKIAVKDNGNGIPEGMHEKIFEPNFTTKSSGTGLGLAFVKNSVENAGGKVWFETATGKGTTFFLSLPIAI
ncbi:HAMP domain-containing sensor histidine kinase [Mucilaginibacter panaciglaebae]|uniref:histidine kinase n=2 Tax=Mucilaginibacter panaciglaebae TaxID=502331 RepID=A0ABP7X116_9SPHI